MALEKIQKKLYRLNVINSIIVLLIPLFSGLNIWLCVRAGQDALDYIFSIFSIVMGLLSILLGILLPAKSAGAHISGKSIRFLTFANLLLNKNITYLSGDEDRPLYRSWNFVGFLIISSFTGLMTGISAFLCLDTHMIPAAAASAAACILWLVLIPTTGFWTYYDGYLSDMLNYHANPGKNILRCMATGALVFFVIIGSAVLYVIIKERQSQSRIPTVNIEQINEQLNDAKSKFDSMSPDDFFQTSEFENIGAALLAVQQSHNGQKMYYNLQYTEDTLNIVSWDDTSEDVFIDCFDILEGNRLKRTKFFLSSSLTKEMIMGQETGILE